MRRHSVFFTLVMALISLAILVQEVSAGAIVIDGDNSDWVGLGLAPVGTDAANNTGSGHDICADLLEAWVYYDSQNLYLMIKVNGGYPADWNTNTFLIEIDTDNNASTGDALGCDYTAGATMGVGVLLSWNDTADAWNPEGSLSVAAGNQGYVEWEVPFSRISTIGTADIYFATYDNDLEEVVNMITVNNQPIPEMPNLLFLLLIMIASGLFVAFRRQRR